MIFYSGIENMFIRLNPFAFVFSLSLACGCSSDKTSMEEMRSADPLYMKFDADVPNDTPKVFAEKIIAPNGEHVGYCAFSPDGTELYYAQTNEHWSESKLIRIHVDSLDKRVPLYLKDRRYEGEPFVTADGDTMYFMAVLPPEEGKQWHADQYRVRKEKDGEWGTPELLDSVINTPASEWHVSLTDDGVLYFTSEREEGTSALHGDIYKATVKGDSFTDLKKLPSPINSIYNDSDPLIAPDESFLIFHSDRPGGFGQHDLYITFYNGVNWTAPVNMGPLINATGWEMAPSLTPDGKYLLYTYREAMVTNNPAKIYWVSTSIIDRYRSPKFEVTE